MAHNRARGVFTVSLLDVKQLRFGYGRQPLLQDVNLSLHPGEIVALLGPSGSGKTSLLRLIAGLLAADSGSILLNGQSTRLGHPDIAYMVQEDLLLPWRNLLQNVTLAQQLRGQPVDRDKALQLLQQLGLTGCEHLYPHQLSGGMRQRAALARTLCAGGKLLLLDEPFGSLDLIRREQLYDLLLQSCLSPERSILLVTHDLQDALRLAHRILIFSNGKILAEVHPSQGEKTLRQLLREAMSHQEAPCRS
jgi:ABC-type nitrate/sulfonate/bicarbonate transport system ATPase subunit